MIQYKLKESLNELKKFKVQTILVLECKKKSDWKIAYSRTKLIAGDSDIDFWQKQKIMLVKTGLPWM